VELAGAVGVVGEHFGVDIDDDLESIAAPALRFRVREERLREEQQGVTVRGRGLTRWSRGTVGIGRNVFASDLEGLHEDCADLRRHAEVPDQ
jgi:hypothetical protein